MGGVGGRGAPWVRRVGIEKDALGGGWLLPAGRLLRERELQERSEAGKPRAGGTGVKRTATQTPMHGPAMAIEGAPFSFARSVIW